MNKPYVICHILSSLDGKINGPFMEAETTKAIGAEYRKLREEMEADAWHYGTTTVKEFINFRKPVLEPLDFEAGDGDFVSGDWTNPYFVCIDAKGELGWEAGRFANKGRPEAHVIEILTEAAPAAYRAYLRKRGVSYIIAGKADLDCKMAMEKLYSLFAIKKLLICGGGAADWSFLQEGMVNELSLVLSPVTDGSSGRAEVFKQIDGVNEGSPVEFELKSVKQLENSGLHLNYLAKNAK